MIRVLITGMSGTGKSTMIQALRELGYAAVDLDEPGWSYMDDQGHQLWHSDRVRRLLDSDQYPVLFLSGCSESQVEFYDELDHVILLSAPQAVIFKRLAERTNNPYGKTADERDDVLENLHHIEPLLRDRCTHEIITTLPPDTVLTDILHTVGC